jgi:transcription antitermination factor NusG
MRLKYKECVIMAKKKEDKELKVGDIVKVNVMKYKNFRGTITEIVNGIAKVVVKCYYNDQQNIVVYQDIRFLKRAEKEREY